jgi:repressor LexA
VYGDLTLVEEQVLRAVRQARMQGYIPSYREIGDSAKLRSTDTVSRVLRRLERKGIVELPSKGKRRGIRLTMEPPPVCVPQLGEIKTGTDFLAEENIEGRSLLTRDLTGEGELFLMRVRGDSMSEADLREGDNVVIRRQDRADKGQIVAAILLAGVDEPELTLKLLGEDGGRLALLPANPAYAAIDVEQSAARIVGRVVALFRRL